MVLNQTWKEAMFEKSQYFISKDEEQVILSIIQVLHHVPFHLTFMLFLEDSCSLESTEFNCELKSFVSAIKEESPHSNSVDSREQESSRKSMNVRWELEHYVVLYVSIGYHFVLRRAYRNAQEGIK
ncbi:hypothetical protein Avbf_06152 [Armadillidium vulgare]|nr:hypothetical protein Avbf_06152 [Armadillidium vulgare]